MVRKPRSGSVIGISGRLANVRLEAVMWEALHDVARRKGCSVDDLVAEISRKYEHEKTPVECEHIVQDAGRELRHLWLEASASSTSR